MLIIFDVDGTLIGGEPFDWKCFNDAFSSETGRTIGDDEWMELEEVTARSLVYHVLSEHPPARIRHLETCIAKAFLKNLQETNERNQNAFQIAPGTTRLLDRLQNDDRFEVGIATGDWLESITFKLDQAGIAIEQYPHATASDARKRADIIALAAQRAGRSIDEVVYVGDGVWDLKACRELDIPFIGTGARTEALTNAGARWTLPILDTIPFLDILEEIQEIDR